DEVNERSSKLKCLYTTRSTTSNPTHSYDILLVGSFSALKINVVKHGIISLGRLSGSSPMTHTAIFGLGIISQNPGRVSIRSL
ncbi:hypothetical protein L9F63_000731, partial [Diploptera punctata]